MFAGSARRQRLARILLFKVWEIDMFKSLIAFEPKFGARALAAGSLLSILAIVYGYAAEKPGEDQDNLKKEQQTKRVGERESQKQKMETKRDEREDQK